jgi:hypothetical protein
VHALARLAHRHVDETDERERGQPAAHVDLDTDVPRAQPVDRKCVRSRKHRSAPWREFLSEGAR